jgi:hypothetical protein
MTLKEKILFHQVHPGKLATDIAAAFISLYFFWQHDLIVGLPTHFLPPPIASFAGHPLCQSRGLQELASRRVPPPLHDANRASHAPPRRYYHGLCGVVPLTHHPSASRSHCRPRGMDLRAAALIQAHLTAISPQAGIRRGTSLHHLAAVADRTLERATKVYSVRMTWEGAPSQPLEAHSHGASNGK